MAPSAPLKRSGSRTPQPSHSSAIRTTIVKKPLTNTRNRTANHTQTLNHHLRTVPKNILNQHFRLSKPEPVNDKLGDSPPAAYRFLRNFPDLDLLNPIKTMNQNDGFYRPASGSPSPPEYSPISPLDGQELESGPYTHVSFDFGFEFDHEDRSPVDSSPSQTPPIEMNYDNSTPVYSSPIQSPSVDIEHDNSTPVYSTPSQSPSTSIKVINLITPTDFSNSPTYSPVSPVFNSPVDFSSSSPTHYASSPVFDFVPIQSSSSSPIYIPGASSPAFEIDSPFYRSFHSYDPNVTGIGALEEDMSYDMPGNRSNSSVYSPLNGPADVEALGFSPLESEFDQSSAPVVNRGCDSDRAGHSLQNSMESEELGFSPLEIESPSLPRAARTLGRTPPGRGRGLRRRGRESRHDVSSSSPQSRYGAGSSPAMKREQIVVGYGSESPNSSISPSSPGYDYPESPVHKKVSYPVSTPTAPLFASGLAVASRSDFILPIDVSTNVFHSVSTPTDPNMCGYLVCPTFKTSSYHDISLHELAKEKAGIELSREAEEQVRAYMRTYLNETIDLIATRHDDMGCKRPVSVADVVAVLKEMPRTVRGFERQLDSEDCHY